MDAHLSQWLNLALRWGHVITGVAWIGTSFYFNWLNGRLAPPPAERAEPGVAGELWSVHGGGFYRVVKYTVAPAALPSTLHWFKWEAYATWLSGFVLLVLIYYLDAAAYLVDTQVSTLSPRAAIAVGVGALVGSWLVYDALCRSRLGQAPLALAGVLFVLGVALAWGLTQLFAPRAAYLHVGAAIGTIMAANVLMVIIPAQQEMVAALAQGRLPDATRGRQAALRSLHNNYFTLPVLFIMVSSHYPATYGHRLNWLILAGLAVVGVATRHWFNLRNQGRHNMWLLPGAAVALVALALITAPHGDGAPSGPAGKPAVSFADVRVIVARRCAPCHSAAPTVAGLATAPLGIALDTPEEIRARAERILAVAVVTHTMPLGNVTAMTDQERALLGNWIRSGATLR
ncbi:MAG: hypothetical protein AUI99_07515 [Gemmatimonadetes bacterium 13_1_40CM_3_69_22]|nr:MAG: hypothetical protein AUI99_07515 [Gemmatimonadetes bacterium 13_1_40CM_3_69_22]PYO13898.1 MAG: hypothetical protein DMD31_11470 [Gemmatimonadota bacterium]